MEKEFIIEFLPYELALKMKQLGFNEPGIASRDMGNGQGLIQIPLYQQAFRWFREKYNLYSEIKVEDNVRISTQKYYWIIFGEYKSLEGNGWIRCLTDSNKKTFNTYEEAELACLTKLIEIVKQKIED